MKSTEKQLGPDMGVGATNTNKRKWVIRIGVSTLFRIFMIALTAGFVGGMWSWEKLTQKEIAELKNELYEKINLASTELPRAIPVAPGKSFSGATTLLEEDFQKLENEMESKTKKTDISSMFSSLLDEAKGILDKYLSEKTIDSVSSEFDVTSDCWISESSLDKMFRGVLKNKGDVFVTTGEKYGISPLFLAGVAMHESGNGESRLAKTLNNVLGVMDGDKPKKFDSVDDCIEYMAGRLKSSKYYVRGGKSTIAEIQKSYCPIGAKNDPTGLNKHWTKGVVSYMNKILDAGKIVSK